MRDILEKLQQNYDDVRKCIPLMNGWKKQTDEDDKLTEFIYSCPSYDDFMRNVKETGCDVSYAAQRWYNFCSSKLCETLLCMCGCRAEKNETHKTIDLYNGETPYDVKLTIYPKQFRREYGAWSFDKKETLIKWFYENQSQQSRKHYANRLFIVCMSDDDYKNTLLKTDVFSLFDAIMNWKMTNHKNVVEIKTDAGYKRVYSDAILVYEKNT